MKRIVSYGGGTNSTALLVGMVNSGIVPDAILFADTGGEKHETYAYLSYFSKWLVSKGFPAIITVKYQTKEGEFIPLEDYLLKRKALPPIAYGYKSCSDKYKIRPVNKYIKEHYRGEQIEMFVGFDAAEQNRVKDNPVSTHTNIYKLIEFGWDRARCIVEILKAGLRLPGKSSCFFCPNMRQQEILKLPKDLQARAVNIEQTAQPNLLDLAGLGRNYKWEDLINADENQMKIFSDEDWHVPPCECIH